MTRLLFLACFASSLAAAYCGAGEPVSADRHQVGYRRTNLTFKTPSGEERRRQLDLWYPTAAEEEAINYRGQKGMAARNAEVAPGRYPLLLFSHGYLGVSDQSIFLTEACARAGYIVASMNHGDALVNIFQKKQDPPKFAEFAKWTDAKYRDRQEDVVALLDQMLAWNKAADSTFSGRIDEQHVGGMGHSLGGYTMLGLAGGWQSWHEPRIKTAVLLSPFAQPYDVNGQLDKVTIPIMLQGGTFDWGITPFLPPVYKKLTCCKSYVVLKNENHFGWTNLAAIGKSTTEIAAKGNPELIVRYAIAFFDQHLLGKDRADVLKAKESRLESLKYDVQPSANSKR
jgi:predicted dienelactone hydrolase